MSTQGSKLGSELWYRAFAVLWPCPRGPDRQATVASTLAPGHVFRRRDTRTRQCGALGPQIVNTVLTTGPNEAAILCSIWVGDSPILSLVKPLLLPFPNSPRNSVPWGILVVSITCPTESLTGNLHVVTSGCELIPDLALFPWCSGS